MSVTKKMKKNKRRIIPVVLTILLIVCAVICTSIAVFPSQSGTVVSSLNSAVNSLTDETETEEKESYIKYQTAENEDYKIKYYSFDISEDDIDTEKIEKGAQIETTDYIYTYGYYWGDPNTAPVMDSLDGWVEQPEYEGWGVAAKNKNKTEYEDIYEILKGMNVTYISNCFANCSNLVVAPLLPKGVSERARAVIDGSFINCTSLEEVIIPEYSYVKENSFKNCTSIKKVCLRDFNETIAISNPSSAFPGLSPHYFWISKEEDMINYYTYN